MPGEKRYKVKSCTGTKCAVINSRSINNKEVSIYQLIVDNGFYFLALTEICCNENSTVSFGQIQQVTLFFIPIGTTRGGGVALILRDTYKAKSVKTGKYKNLIKLSVTTIYIPSGIFSSEFNEQISDLLSKLLSLPGKHVILCDFKLRVNNPTDTHAAKFKALTEQFN